VAAGLRGGTQVFAHEIFFLKRFKHGDAVVFVLGRNRVAAQEIAGFGAHGVGSDAFPEGVENHHVAVVNVDAGAA